MFSKTKLSQIHFSSGILLPHFETDLSVESMTIKSNRKVNDDLHFLY